MQLSLLETKTAEIKFQQFHLKNPQVYQILVRLARQLANRGHRRLGMQMLFEVLRWQSMLQTTGDEYKINNNYAAFYSRLIMDQEADLAGIFEVRESKI